MPDTQSRYRVARLSLYPPSQDGGHYRYALTASKIRNGVPTAQIIVDGVLPGGVSSPTTEELLMALDAAIRAHMLT